MFSERLKNNHGITLIALVITIVVLLILAGVTIATLTGDNGILTKAQEAKTKTEEAQKQEEAQLKDLEDYINGIVVSEDGFDKAKKFSVQQLTEELGYNLDQCGFPHEEEEILEPMELIRRYEEQRASLNAEIDQVLEEITSLLGGVIE